MLLPPLAARRLQSNISESPKTVIASFCIYGRKNLYEVVSLDVDDLNAGNDLQDLVCQGKLHGGQIV